MKKNWRWLLSITMVTTLIVFSGCATTGHKAVATGPMTAKQLVMAAKAVVPQVTPAQAKANIDKGTYKVIVDVREPKEFRKGHIPGAINIPRGLLEFKVTAKIPDKATPILVYCKTGGRGALSGQALMKMGYKNVTNMDGGWMAWEKAGYPVE